MDKKFERLHIRHCILHLFHCGIHATKACKIIQETYGVQTVSKRTCQKWYKKFIEVDFDLEDKPHPNRGVKVMGDDVKAIYYENPSMSTREMGKQLGVDATTISRKLIALGIKKPKELKRKQEDEDSNDHKMRKVLPD